MKKRLFVAISLAYGIVMVSGCQKSSTSTEQGSPVEQSNPSSQPSQPQATSQAPTGDTAKQDDQADLKKALQVPLSDYMDVTGNKNWPSEWALANQDGFTDEDIMNTMEPGYNNEQNAFKKHQMLESDLAKFKTQIAKFKGKSYFKFSDGDNNIGLLDGPYFFYGYDFKSQSFKVTDNPCLGPSTPDSNPNLLWLANKKLCSINVTDQSIAEKIENARMNSDGHGLLTLGTYYVNAIDYEGSNLKVQAIHAHYDIYVKNGFRDPDGHTKLLSVDL